ncbi:MAG: Uma2 family endonuclease [Acidobacteriota bacterium]|nr:Uma2 family endonuclease [Acidobacteriota bacterium]
MSTTTHLMTADELLVMPHYENGNDFRCELIRGELKKMSPTGVTHGILCARLAAALINFVEGNDLGVVCGAETGFIVEKSPDTVVGADVAFVSHERLKQAENLNKFLPVAPDLAVEVLSPGNTVDEIDEKIALYFAAGARMVWIVSPKRRTVAVYRSPIELQIVGEDETLDGGDVLPNFRLELSKLFSAIKR